MALDRMMGGRSAAGLYEQHGQGLVQFATALVGPDDAPDVVSEAMLSLLRNGQLASADNPVALMHRAVLSKARSMQRSAFARRRREQRFADRWVVEHPGAQPEIVASLIHLSSRQRACVYLTYWEDLSPQMVADRLGVGEGSVKRHLARARAKLREVLHD